MKHFTGLLFLAGLLLASPAAAQLSLTIHDGKVTLTCDNTPARQILAEWARLGQTKVVGAEKLTGPPLTLRLENVPEQQALEIVLRAASGYIAADRPTIQASASRYDRILIMPPSAPVAGGAAAGRGAVPAPPIPVQPAYNPQPAPEPAEDVNEQDAEPQMSPNTGDARPPETNFDYANPQEFLRRRQELMQQQQQQSGPPTTFPGTVLPGGGMPGGGTQPVVTPVPGMPTAPVGSTRPGEIVKPPQTQPTFQNPYGLPYNIPPGSAPTANPEPDRAKYANPYQPTPPPPQDE